MGMLYKQHVAESAGVFSIIMGCFVATSLTYIFGTLLTANGNLMQLNLMAASGMGLNLLLNIILIPHYKAIGAAYSSVITQFLTALLQIYLAQRIFKFRVNYRLLVQLVIFVLSVFMIGVLCKNLFDDWLKGIFVLLLGGTLSAFAIGLLHVKSIFRIMKYG
jgi:O-antigen/teichoic acid export membrane protein